MTTEQKIQELEKQLEELKQEIAKQDKKEHKSLSDYRVYEELENGEQYKSIDEFSNITEDTWKNDDLDKEVLRNGIVYLYETPNELLEREIKKRQLWFALEKHLKENNCLATDEAWKIKNRSKYCVVYDIIQETFNIISWCTRKYNTIYSTNLDVLENYMNTLSEEDIKIMFDVD